MFTVTKDAGEPFEFYITRLRNPIAQSPVAFEITTFEAVAEITPDDNQYLFTGVIDRGETFLEAVESIGIRSEDCSVAADDSTV